MPFRRRRYFRKKRMFGRRSFRNVRKKLMKKYTGRNQILAKLRGVIDVSSNAFGTVMGFQISTTDPNSFDHNSNQLQDWGNFGAIYDQYRVCAIKLHWIPLLPNNVSSSTEYSPFYVVADWDSGTMNTLTTAEAIEYGNLKVKNLYRPWKIYYRIPRGFNTEASATMVGSLGWMDVDATQAIGTIQGTIGSNPITGSTTYGQLICTYYIAFKNQR